jgi:uncharacterized protein (TIGR00369 family)
MPILDQAEKAQYISRLSRYIPHAAELGIRLERIEGEEITLRLPYRDELIGNPDTGVIHSGALTVLLDHTLGVAGLCSDRVGAMITPTLDLRIDHLGTPPAGQDIMAWARVYKVTRRILFVEGVAYCESREKPVARATGTWVLMPELDLKKLMAPEQAGAQQQ